ALQPREEQHGVVAHDLPCGQQHNRDQHHVGVGQPCNLGIVDARAERGVKPRDGAGDGVVDIADVGAVEPAPDDGRADDGGHARQEEHRAIELHPGQGGI
ncbi:hypothetical protein CEN41_01200, partial [Fischerella thermalis CCMEE 5330]